MQLIKRTTGDDPDFIVLVKVLDRYLAEMDGDEHAFYATYNTLDAIRHVVVLYDGNTAIACGAIKPFDEQSMEVKRMFTSPGYRGQGLAGKVLATLEQWAGELGYTRCVLETGKRQQEAIALYVKSGYHITLNYGQYTGIENSVCFEKLLPVFNSN